MTAKATRRGFRSATVSHKFSPLAGSEDAPHSRLNIPRYCPQAQRQADRIDTSPLSCETEAPAATSRLIDKTVAPSNPPFPFHGL
jgi:hypothetical protein